MYKLGFEVGYKLFIQEMFVGSQQQAPEHASKQQDMEKVRRIGKQASCFTFWVYKLQKRMAGGQRSNINLTPLFLLICHIFLGLRPLWVSIPLDIPFLIWNSWIFIYYCVFPKYLRSFIPWALTCTWPLMSFWKTPSSQWYIEDCGTTVMGNEG